MNDRHENECKDTACPIKKPHCHISDKIELATTTLDSSFAVTAEKDDRDK